MTATKLLHRAMNEVPLLQRSRVSSVDRRKYLDQDEMNSSSDEESSYDSYFEDHTGFVVSTNSSSFQIKKDHAMLVAKVPSMTERETSSSSSSHPPIRHEIFLMNRRVDEEPIHMNILFQSERKSMKGMNVRDDDVSTGSNRPHSLNPMTIQRTCSEETRAIRNTFVDHEDRNFNNNNTMESNPFCSESTPCLGEGVSLHRRDYSTSGSLLTYSEDDTDESIRWNERLVGSREDDGEWNQLLQSVGDFNSLYQESTQMESLLQKEFPSSSSSSKRVEKHFEQRRDPPLIDSNTTEGGFKVYRERWLMLFYMCLLNILSDWTCYSIAPISLLISEEYPRIDPQALVTIFLISSSISTLLEPMILARVGLRRTILFGAFLLMIGNVVKSGFIRMLGMDLQADLSPGRIYTGFFLVGLSQPLYQCTPALLSASWFPDDERTLATGLALNSNQLGIGFAFTFGTLLVDSRSSILPYFTLLSILSSIVFLGCVYSLQDAPPTPPSKTAARVIRGNWMKLFKKNDDMSSPIIYGTIHRKNHVTNDTQEQNPTVPSTLSVQTWHVDEGVEPIMIQSGRYLAIDILDDQLLRSIRACFSKPGFVHTLVAFTVSSVVVNVISTYMDYLMRIGGADSLHVGLVGGLFQLVIVISGILVGKATDQTRSYYSAIIGLLVLGAFALAECGIDLDRGSDLQWSLLLTAIFVGPLQPIATELGVDVCFPLCENTVLVIQQLFASLVSAMFIPLFQAVSNVGQQVEGADDRPQYIFSLYLLIVIHAAGTVFFATFNGQYLRLQHENESQNI